MKNINTRNLIDELRVKVGSKSDYLPKTVDEARQNLIERAHTSVAKLRAGEVRPYHPAPIAKQQKKTQMFCVKFGYGDNNAYFANSVLKASQVLKYETAEEAASDIENLIIPLAKAGDFDDGLKATLEKHRRLADKRKKKVATNRAAYEVETQALNSADSTVAAE